ncbi:type VI secretion protein [Salmonella enterica]|nr:type VI secretion protein [Salmonella enterica]EHI6359536.1 type VI secretion protein [Salmonella enterica]EHI9810729.1 type VI secretion protein [Salmonella enterica]
MKIAFLSTAMFVTTLTSFAAVADDGEYMDFTAANQCRSQPDDAKRIACYDKAITPTRTKTLDKFESRDQCRDEAREGKRLSCYDYFYPPTFTGSQVKKSIDKVGEDVGNWKTDIKTSPIDDSKNVVIFINGDNSFRSPFGETITPSLYIACRENKTELFISWDVYLGLDETTMIYRIDKQKAVNKTWLISTDTKAVFYNGKVIDFIKRLESGQKLFTQITPYNENPVSTTFNLSGLSEAIKPLQESCGWK